MKRDSAAPKLERTCKCGNPIQGRDTSCKDCQRAYYAKWSAEVEQRLADG